MTTDEIIEKTALEYAAGVVVNPSKHPDAVEVTMNDFSQGAYWMLDEVCKYLRKELQTVQLYSGTNNDEGIVINASRLVLAHDNTPDEFITRLREDALGGE